MKVGPLSSGRGEPSGEVSVDSITVELAQRMASADCARGEKGSAKCRAEVRKQDGTVAMYMTASA